MCSRVIFLSPEGYEKVPPIVCFSPAELQDYVLYLVDIHDELLDDCWCVNDPEPTLLANGYDFEIEIETGDYHCREIAAVSTASIFPKMILNSKNQPSLTSYEF